MIRDEALKTSEIEGEILDRESVQSSLRLQFGLDGDKRRVPPAERGVAEMMVDLYRTHATPLTTETLCAWHTMLMAGQRGLHLVGGYRTHVEPMQVVSGRIDRPSVHFEAPPSAAMAREIKAFIRWFNDTAPTGQHPRPVLTRAGLAHLYFVSIHPFEDGNGRIARAIAEKALAQGLGQPSLIALAFTIERGRNDYYDALERNNKGIEITEHDAIFFTRETARKPIVVVVGCGFGGLQAAYNMAKLDIELVLIDRTNHHLFQPLLYQVSTAALSPSDIASPIRALLGQHKNVSVVFGEVDGIDKDLKQVCIRDTGTIDYDYLILATGSAYAWFGHDEWSQHATVLKTLPDALLIRRRILESFDWAETRKNPDEVKALTTFVIIGGGPTGVELAGSLAELARRTLVSEYRHIDPTKARIVLVDARSRILSEFPEPLSLYAATALETLGVEVRLNAPCEVIDASGVTIRGERIESANVFWAAGTRAQPAGDWIGAAKAKNDCVEVTNECSVPNHPDIFAIGDVSSFKTADGQTLPGLAPVAKQQGAYVAKVIASRIGAAKHPGPFKYTNLGTMAVIGRSHAIAVLGGVKLTGRLAWLAWSLVHLLLLIGFRNRVMVFTNWAWAFVTYGRGARLVVGRQKRLAGDVHLAGPDVVE